MSIEDRNGHLHGGDGKYREKAATAPGPAATLTARSVVTTTDSSGAPLVRGGFYGFDRRGDLYRVQNAGAPVDEEHVQAMYAATWSDTIYFIADGPETVEPPVPQEPEVDTVFRITVTEHERGWGLKSETEDYATVEAAQARIRQINAANTSPTAPGWYMTASDKVEAVSVPRVTAGSAEDEDTGEWTSGPEMFTPEGNRAVRDAIEKMRTAIQGGTLTPAGVRGLVYEEFQAVSAEHPEVYDTEPRAWIVDQVNVTLRENGYAELTEFPF